MDSIYKLLDLFFSLHIEVCSVCYPAQGSSAFFSCSLLPSYSQQEEELLLQRHPILKEANFCRKRILFWGVPNRIQGSFHVTNSTPSWRSAAQAAKDQLAGMDHTINISGSVAHGKTPSFYEFNPPTGKQHSAPKQQRGEQLAPHILVTHMWSM